MRGIALVLLAAVAACSHSQSSGAPPPQPAASGPVGDLAAYGRELIVHTRAHMKPYVTANMDCSACHVNAGTKPRGGTFVGIAAQFPQWNKRSRRVITLQDRLAECFLYSMNGHPPAYNSREMIAMVAYITDLSRGTPIGHGPDPGTRLAQFRAQHAPDGARGSTIYAQKCSMCHGANGAGNAVYPPLWGSTSFNGGAGMHRVETMAVVRALQHAAERARNAVRSRFVRRRGVRAQARAAEVQQGAHGDVSAATCSVFLK